MELKKTMSLLIGISLIHLLLFIVYLILYWGISNQMDFALNNYDFVLNNVPFLFLNTDILNRNIYYNDKKES